jgi:hypothetical protein
MLIEGAPSDVNKFVNVKRYGTAYKLTLLKCLPAGDRGAKEDVCGDEEETCKVLSDKKMDCNISRARAKIFELAMCNDWSHFATFTLDGRKYDRSDLKKFQADLSLFIRHQRTKWKAPGIKYLLIPELHDDLENWHMHGLLGGVKEEMLSEFLPGIHPQYLVDNGFRNWPDYYHKFGFVSLGIIRSKDQVAKYITKYITKDMAKSVQEVGGHMYFRSKGLEGLEVIKKGTLAQMPPSWEFENDYVKIVWIEAHEVNKYVK